MIPNITVLTEEITEAVYPNKTYKIAIDKNRIDGYTNDLEALMQAIYLILSTERYEFLIYSWDYGVELIDLIGKPMPYVMAELPRRITEALTQDDRVEDVLDFEFEKKGKYLYTSFTLVSNVGEIPMALNLNFTNPSTGNTSNVVVDRITLTDTVTNKTYIVYIENGKLTMSELQK